jgi:hypothetical protein
MTQTWFIPVGFLVAVVGTRTALSCRHMLRDDLKERAWWLLLVLAWSPMAFWLLSQFIVQE